MKSSKKMIFIVIGVIVLLFALVQIWQNYKFINRASSATGTVSSLNAGGSHPEIDFQTDNGQKISYPQGGLIFGYKVGDQITVLYDVNDPNNASINSFGALWGFVLLEALLGIIFVAVGLAV